MKTIIATLTTVTALSFGTMAFADTRAEVSQGYDMLATSLMGDFERMGIPTATLDTLTLGQLAAIKETLEDGDESNDKGQVEAIIYN